MAQHRPAVADRQISIGDKTYTLRFSVRAMAALQDHFKLASLTEVGEKLQDAATLGVKDLVALLWAGLQTHHRDLSMDDALTMLDEMGLDRMQETLGHAMAAALPEASGDAEESGDPQ